MLESEVGFTGAYIKNVFGPSYVPDPFTAMCLPGETQDMAVERLAKLYQQEEDRIEREKFNKSSLGKLSMYQDLV